MAQEKLSINELDIVEVVNHLERCWNGPVEMLQQPLSWLRKWENEYNLYLTKWLHCISFSFFFFFFFDAKIFGSPRGVKGGVGDAGKIYKEGEEFEKVCSRSVQPLLTSTRNQTAQTSSSYVDHTVFDVWFLFFSSWYDCTVICQCWLQVRYSPV